MKKVKIGLIGAGNIAREHLKSYAELDNVEIAAVCDINEKRLNNTADDFGIANRYTSVEAMLAAEKELDAADVCVWNCNHAKCTIAALNAGLHVLCEKPMAYTAKEAEEMKACADRNGKLLMIGFVTRFEPETKVVKDFIDNGYVGDIYYAKAQYIRRHGAPGGWFCDKSRSGGGPVIDLGVHVIDRTRYLMGKPTPVSVYAATFNKLGKRDNLKTGVNWFPDDAAEQNVCDVEDMGIAMIRFDNGAVIQLETSYSINGESVNGLDLYGTKGGFRTGRGPLVLYNETNDFMTDTKIDYEDYRDAKPMFVAEMEQFVNWVADGVVDNSSAEDGIIVMKILDAIYESARCGHEVEIK